MSFRKSCLLASLTLAATPALASVPVLPTALWVAPTGVDTAGCGPATSPCRTLQYAHDHIAAGGQITIAGSGGYGALTITKSLSIVNDGGGTARLIIPSGVGITVNAGPLDVVFLKGFDLDGVGTGTNGIEWDAGHKLRIEHCTIRNFTNYGIWLQPVKDVLPGPSQTVVFSSAYIENSSISDNGAYGVIAYPPKGAALLTYVTNSTASGNANNGFASDGYPGGASFMYVMNSVAFGNGQGMSGYSSTDVQVYYGAVLTLGGSSIGTAASDSVNGSTLNSNGDNHGVIDQPFTLVPTR